MRQTIPNKEIHHSNKLADPSSSTCNSKWFSKLSKIAVIIKQIYQCLHCNAQNFLNT